jgi:hypothetical protein
MFATLKISVSNNDELTALLADYTSCMGDDSGLASTSPLADFGDQTDSPADLAIGPASVAGLDGLVEISDGNFAFDRTILEVGRTFGGPSFMDLP